MARRKSTRRDFLRGKAAVRAAADAARGRLASAGLWPEDVGDHGYLIRISRRAMACDFEVVLNAGQYEAGTEAALAALDLVEVLEDQMTVFRTTSQISRLNRTAAHEAVEVEPRLFRLLERALELHRATDGAFDVTAGPLWRAWGFARRQATLPSDDAIEQALACVGSHLIDLDTETRTVRFRKPGVELNLGGIGKGYAVDRCVETLTASGVEQFLLDGGQSSVRAMGSKALRRTDSDDAASLGWVVGLADPLRPLRRLAELRLRDRALGTSGSGRQFFHHEGRRYGHVIDPRTGWPADGLLSATVVAPTATEADALATAFSVMGPQKALDYCRARPELGAVLVAPHHAGPGFEVHTIGLEDDELRILVPSSDSPGLQRG